MFAVVKKKPYLVDDSRENPKTEGDLLIIGILLTWWNR